MKDNISETGQYDIPTISLLTLFFTMLTGIAVQKFFTIPHSFAPVAMILALCFAFCVWVFWVKNRNITVQNIIMLIFAFGVLMRLSFVAIVSAQYYQHDVFDTNGHFDYIMYIVNNLSLPESNNWQFYHPPLHYIISAVILKPFSLMGITDRYTLGNILQYYTSFLSSMIMLICIKLFDRLNLSALPKIVAFSIIAFHPTFFILGGSLNNDCLCVFFMFLCVYYTVKWYKNPHSVKTTALLAVFFGLAMMSKISSAMLAFPIAFIFIYRLFKMQKDIDKKKHIKTIISRYALFLIIAVPLSLWYPIRNFIKFSQNFGYVPSVGDSGSWQYCGDVPLIDRLNPFLLNPTQLFCDVGSDFNLASYTAKCSVFGEWKISYFTIGAYFLLIANFILIVISLACMMFALVKTRNKFLKPLNIFFVILWTSQVISFIITNINYPFGCTMDFRYIVLTVLTGVYFIAVALQNLKSRAGNIAVSSACVLFCLSSILTYAFVN